MNILPPPQFGVEQPDPNLTMEERVKRLEEIVLNIDNKIQRLLTWCRDVYKFLNYPVFHLIRLKPRATVESPEEGTVYYDEDDQKFKGYTSSFEDFN